MGMGITRIEIGGRESDADNGFWFEEFSLTRNLGDRPSRLGLTVIPKDAADTAWLRTTAEIFVTATDSTRLFGGYITVIDHELVRRGELWYPVECADFSLRLHSVQHISTRTFENRSDQEILQILFREFSAQLGGISAEDFVEVVSGNVADFTLENISLFEGVRRLAELTGAQWYIDNWKNLRWFSPVNYRAPISLSDSPDAPNLLRYTEQVGVIAPWTVTGLTVVGNVVQRPPVTARNVAERLYGDGDDGSHHVQQQFEVPRAGDLVLSAYLLNDPDDHNGTGISYFRWRQGSDIRIVWFDLAAGTASTTAANTTPEIQDVSEDVGGAPWYRCIARLSSVAAGDGRFRIGLGARDSSNALQTQFTAAATANMIVTAAQATMGTTAAPYRQARPAAEVERYRVESWAEDHSEIATRVTVIAGEGVTERVDDTEAQALYGIWHAVLTDRSLTTVASARLLAQSELVRRALPQTAVDLVTEGDGLEPGQEVLVNAEARGRPWQTFLVRAVRSRFEGRDMVHRVTLGPPVRDFDRLQQLLRYELTSQNLRVSTTARGSSRTVMIYRRSTTTPAAPSGGSVSGSTYTPPSGWTLTVPDGSDPLWGVLVSYDIEE